MESQPSVIKGHFRDNWAPQNIATLNFDDLMSFSQSDALTNQLSGLSFKFVEVFIIIGLIIISNAVLSYIQSSAYHGPTTSTVCYPWSCGTKLYKGGCLLSSSLISLIQGCNVDFKEILTYRHARI